MAKEIGMKSFLECLEENPKEGKFSIPFKHSYFVIALFVFIYLKKLEK